MKNIIQIFLFVALFANNVNVFAQESVYHTFKDTRVINVQTVEMIPHGKVDFRIGHRFGDLVGENGGWDTFYGLEQVSDVTFGFEYGFKPNITLGLHRTKGAGPLRSNVFGFSKYQVIQQGKNGMPVTATVLGMLSMGAKSRDADVASLQHFAKFSHRLTYGVQLLLAHKFSNRFSLQLIPGYTHRNIVYYDDQNGIFSMGAAAKIQLTKASGIILDATFPFSKKTYDGVVRTPALGIGWEIETGGHVFQLNFTNARGINETDYIPYTSTKWSKGEFRFGFTVARRFSI